MWWPNSKLFQGSAEHIWETPDYCNGAQRFGGSYDFQTQGVIESNGIDTLRVHSLLWADFSRGLIAPGHSLYTVLLDSTKSQSISSG